MISQFAPKHGFRPGHIATLSPCELARGLTETRQLVHPRHISQSRRDPFPNAERWRGYGRDASRIARPIVRTCIEPFLLSTPHPALRATFPASRRRETLAVRAQLDK